VVAAALPAGGRAEGVTSSSVLPRP
jgi:hypothetical protein